MIYHKLRFENEQNISLIFCVSFLLLLTLLLGTCRNFVAYLVSVSDIVDWSSMDAPKRLVETARSLVVPTMVIVSGVSSGVAGTMCF